MQNKKEEKYRKQRISSFTWSNTRSYINIEWDFFKTKHLQTKRIATQSYRTSAWKPFRAELKKIVRLPSTRPWVCE